jgi:hypothetical protein
VCEPTLGREVATPSKLVGRAHDPDGHVGHRRDVELIRERRSQSDDLLDGVRLARRKHLGQDSATAVADDADARAGLFADRQEPGAQPGDQVLGVLHVELDA